MRTVGIIVCMVLALLCGYGLLATFEPGAHIAWQIGYGLGIIGFFVAALVIARRAK